jgi:hypothetical protein
MICTFCKNKGIQGPHNHTVRNWTLPNKPIICPNLLSNTCTFCKNNGHTRQYCNIRIELEKLSDNNRSDADIDMECYNNIFINLKRPLDNADSNLNLNKMPRI